LEQVNNYKQSSKFVQRDNFAQKRRAHMNKPLFKQMSFQGQPTPAVAFNEKPAASEKAAAPICMSKKKSFRRIINPPGAKKSSEKSGRCGHIIDERD
jgi:hypothetical protein